MSLLSALDSSLSPSTDWQIYAINDDGTLEFRVPLSAILALLEAGDIPDLSTIYAALVHAHVIGDVTGLQAALDALTAALAGKAATSHTHTIANVTGLQTDIDDLTAAIAAKADAAATTAALATKADDAATTAALATKASDSATTTALAGKLPVLVDGLPDIDHSANGPQTSTFAAGASITVMDCVYLGSGGKWLKSDADAAATAAGLLAISLESKNDTEAMKVALPGSFVRDDTWAWTVGAPIYLSGTPGALTETPPAAEDSVTRVVGFAFSADVIWFDPSPDYVTHA